MIKKITFNSRSSETIILDSEKPYLKTLKIRFLNIDINELQKKHQDVALKYTKRVKSRLRHELDNVEESVPLLPKPEIIRKTSEIDFPKIINKADEFRYAEVDFILENVKLQTEIELWYETEDLLPFDKESISFKQHFENNGNIKILFSGAFGTGKTTFLREYFNEKTNYDVFHLFPVNYSVANNDDIFRYIKAELLFLLLEKDIEFDQIILNKLETAPAFLKEYSLEILLPFVRLIPQIGKNLHEILNDLIQLKTKFESYHNEFQVDDKEKAKKFINDLYEKEGSVFEDNFFTQLINQLLEKIKSEGKQTVLIIDDLDRIDPEHVFRILNVFAAQFDQRDQKGTSSNKFGFDFVILVCHYENLKKIFQYKYGLDTDFSGYVDKYFSKSIFEFYSNDIILNLINEAFEKKKNENLHIYKTILLVLANENNLTLREAIKLTNNELRTIMEHGLPFTFKCIRQLCKVIDNESLIIRIDNCAKSNRIDHESFSRFNFNYPFQEALADFLFYNTDISDSLTKEYTLVTQNLKITMTVNDYFRNRKIESCIVKKDDKEVPHKFNRSDFFFILGELAKLYKNVYH